MSDKISLNIEGKLITVSKSILQQFTYFKSIIERWNAEPIFTDCDHKLFRHLLDIARIPNYTVPITELDNVTKLADYYGLKTDIPKCPKKKMTMGRLYDLYHHKYVISNVKYMLFHNIRGGDSSSILINSKPNTRIDFKIQWTDDLKIMIVKGNVFMTRKPNMDKPQYPYGEGEQKIICPEFLPLFQEPFIIYHLDKNELNKNVWVTIIY